MLAFNKVYGICLEPFLYHLLELLRIFFKLLEWVRYYVIFLIPEGLETEACFRMILTSMYHIEKMNRWHRNYLPSIRHVEKMLRRHDLPSIRHQKSIA